MTREEQLELADKILKAYEAWARDCADIAKHSQSVESRYDNGTDEIEEANHANLCEEALECCRHALASMSDYHRMNIKAQYTGLQGYYRRKVNPKRLARARRQPFDNVIWQGELDLSLSIFLNLLKRNAGEAFKRYFVCN